MQKKDALHRAASLLWRTTTKQDGIFIEQSSPYCDTDLEDAGVGKPQKSELFPLFSPTVCLTDQQMGRAWRITFCLFLSRSLRVLRRNETVKDWWKKPAFSLVLSPLLLPPRACDGSSRLSWSYRDKPGLVGFGFVAIASDIHACTQCRCLTGAYHICMQTRGFCGSEHSRLVYLRLFLRSLDSLCSGIVCLLYADEGTPDRLQ